MANSIKITGASAGNVVLGPTGAVGSSANPVLTITAGSGAVGGYTVPWNGTTGSTWNTTYTTNPSLKVSGDANIEGNLTVQGVDITDLLAKIQQRLAILVPDPKLLEKYEALREAYDHYRTLEALCVNADVQKE